MMIKVCGITRRADAEVAVDAGASALGFIFFAKSPRNVTPAIAKALGERLAVWKVGVFVDQAPDVIETIMRAAQLDIAQIYGGAAPSYARVWKAFRVEDAFDQALASGAEAVLMDGPRTGVPFDWKLARGVAEKVIIAGGLSASNVAEAIGIARPWGVDASSSLESTPGIKDHKKVRQFVKAAREARL